MASSKPKTIEDFLADNDRDTIIRTRIKAAFAAMLKIGPHEHDTEMDFAKRCDMQVAELTRYRDEFSKHVAYVPKLMGRRPRFVWFADAKVVPVKFRYTPEITRG